MTIALQIDQIRGKDSRCKSGSKAAINAAKAAERGKRFRNDQLNDLADQARQLLRDRQPKAPATPAAMPAAPARAADEALRFVAQVESLGLDRVSHAADSISYQRDRQIQIGEWYHIIGAESLGMAKVLGGGADALAISFESFPAVPFAIHPSRIKAPFTDAYADAMTQAHRQAMSDRRHQLSAKCREHGVNPSFLWGA